MESNKKIKYKFFVPAPSRFSGMGPSGSKKFVFAFFVVTIFFLAGFFLINHTSKNLTPENIKYVKISGQNIKVDLALTPAEQTQGLSGRSSLDNNTGMLFIFEYPGNYPFWMKDMNFAIDIIWLDENMKVIYIKKDARPEDYPATYGPDGDAKYVLEVASGFSEKNNLKEGDKVEFVY